MTKEELLDQFVLQALEYGHEGIYAKAPAPMKDNKGIYCARCGSLVLEVRTLEKTSDFSSDNKNFVRHRGKEYEDDYWIIYHLLLMFNTNQPKKPHIKRKKTLLWEKYILKYHVYYKRILKRNVLTDHLIKKYKHLETTYDYNLI